MSGRSIDGRNDAASALTAVLFVLIVLSAVLFGGVLTVLMWA